MLLKNTKIVTNKERLFIVFLFLITCATILLYLLNGTKSYAVENNLLPTPWHLTGDNGAVENYQQIDKNSLKGKDTLTLTYNLHGTCLLDGDASAIIFDQPNEGDWHLVSLSQYGKNCFDGEQTVQIPLHDFTGLDLTQPVALFHVRFWSTQAFTIDITSVVVSNNNVPASSQIDTPTPVSSDTTFGVNISPTPSPLVTPIPTATPVAPLSPTPSPTITPLFPQGSWAIESVDAMKETKDKICGQDSQSFINTWLDTAKSLGVNYIAISTPYDNPSCGSSVSYTKTWIDAVRAHGLHVWHRHMPMAFEGIYNTSKSKNDFLNMIGSYIKDNPSFFQDGDIFTPIPEPQNGGINGVTGCTNNICQFDSAANFNQWLRGAMTTSTDAFSSIGLGGKIKVGYFGFDGFIAWGDANPDWHGILEDSTVQQMGNITIDHYPELINETMKQGLDALQAKYPNVPIVIGEWGSAGTTDPEQQVQNSMGAAKRTGVVGFNYWEMGMGGNEALINSDFSHKSQFADVQSFFGGH